VEGLRLGEKKVVVEKRKVAVDPLGAEHGGRALVNDDREDDRAEAEDHVGENPQHPEDDRLLESGRRRLALKGMGARGHGFSRSKS
jgi:hypothetical protein